MLGLDATHFMNCRAFDLLAPASSPFGLPVYVARPHRFHSMKRQRRLGQTPYKLTIFDVISHFASAAASHRISKLTMGVPKGGTIVE